MTAFLTYRGVNAEDDIALGWDEDAIGDLRARDGRDAERDQQSNRDEQAIDREADAHHECSPPRRARAGVPRALRAWGACARTVPSESMRKSAAGCADFTFGESPELLRAATHCAGMPSGTWEFL